MTVTPAAEQEAVAHLSGQHVMNVRRERQLCYVIFIPAGKDQCLEMLAVASASTRIPVRLKFFKSRQLGRKF